MATIYEAKFLSPDNETLDMLVAQDFTATVQGSQITHFQVIIYNNSTGATLYDSTKTALSPVLYNNDTLTHEVPITGAIAAIRELKWTLATWNGTDTVTTREKFFKNYEVPTVSLTGATITEQEYEFIGTYAQAQSIDPEKFKFTLYDSAQVELENSDWVFSGSVRYTFDGLVNGETYYCAVEVYDFNEVYATSGLVSYTVSYTQPSVDLQPDVTNIEDSSAIQVVWSGVFSNIGVSTGTIEYVDGDDGKELYLHEFATAYWEDLQIDEEFTYSKMWRPKEDTFIGEISRQENTVTYEYISVGYTGTEFYLDASGKITDTSVLSIDSTKNYVILYTSDSLYVVEETP